MIKRSFVKLIIFIGVMLFGLNPLNAETTADKRGGELRVQVGYMPRHLNPAIQSGSATGIPGRQLFASLLRVDRNWKHHPYLAESWRVSEDGLVYTFRLRKGATFHDGKPITSEDVAFSMMTVKKHHPFSTMLAAVEEVKTPDPLTARVKLSRPHAALLLVAASPMMPILPRHIYGDGQDIKSHPANWKVVGSGPFRLGLVTKKRIVLERYDGFFMPGRPYLDRIVIARVDAVAPSFETGAGHFQGQISNPLILEELEQIEHLRFDNKGYDGIGPLMWLAFNLEKKPFNDIRVRQAVAYGIDRKFMIEKLFKGGAREATGPISPGAPFYSDDVAKHDIDLKKANSLLDAAGYPRDSKGIRFTAKLVLYEAAMRIPVIVSKYMRNELLKNTGIMLELITYKNFSSWVKIVSNREFSLTMDNVFNWGDPVIGVHRTYMSNNIRKGVIWSNTQAYRNPEVDSLLEEAGMEMDFEKRKALYLDFQKITVKDLPVYWLMTLPYTTVYHKNLRGVDQSIWGVIFPYDQLYWDRQP